MTNFVSALQRSVSRSSWEMKLERGVAKEYLSLELENNFAIINNNKFSLQISTRKKYSREFYPLRRAPSPREEVTGRWEFERKSRLMRGRKLDDESRIESEKVRDGRSAYKKKQNGRLWRRTRNGGCNCFPIIIKWCTATRQNPCLLLLLLLLTNSLFLSSTKIDERKGKFTGNRIARKSIPSPKWSIEEMEERRIWKKEKKKRSEFQRGEWRKRRRKGTLTRRKQSEIRHGVKTSENGNAKKEKRNDIGEKGQRAF